MNSDDLAELKRKIKQHVWGPVGSVVFHVVVVLLVVIYASSPSSEVAPEVEVTMMETKADTLEKVEEVVKKELEKVEPPKEDDKVVDHPSDMPTSTIDVPADAPGSGLGDAAGVGIGSGDPSLAAGFEVAMAKSPLVMKGLYSTRTAAGRKGGLSAFGGSKRGEDTVMRALRWLKENQDPDGAWKKADPTSAPAMAGLALLCFLAHGETPSSPEFGATVEKAMKYIVAQQKPNGGFGANAMSQHGVYEHAICTYAVSEAFGLTKIMALKEAMEKGIQVIIDGQQPSGGYDYAYKKDARWDLSVAGWQFQALKAAKMAGCVNDKIEPAINKSTQFLRTVAHQPGAGFGYAAPQSSPSMTGAGTLCLQLLGKPECSEVREGLNWMNETKNPIFDVVWQGAEAAPAGADPKKKAADGKGKNPVYAWYYITQAKFQKGGKDWQVWNPKFATAVIRSQIIEGKLGHWEGGDHGGSVYTTALCCLMLEVYYRYLPTFKHVDAAPDAAAVKKTDDVEVKL